MDENSNPVLVGNESKEVFLTDSNGNHIISESDDTDSAFGHAKPEISILSNVPISTLTENRDCDDDELSLSPRPVEMDPMYAALSLVLNWEKEVDADADNNNTNAGGPNLQEIESDYEPWNSWSPETEKYWTVQYSKGKHGQISTKTAKRSPPSDLRINIPPDGDFVPNRTNDNKNRRPTSSDDNQCYMPFAHCSARPHRLAPRFLDRTFQAQFLGKILMVKSVQMFILYTILYSIRFLPSSEFKRIQTNPIGIGYIAFFTYAMIFSCARCFVAGRRIMGALLTLVVCTFCSAVACATLYYNNGLPQVVAAVIVILGLTYATLGLITYFTKMDVSEQGNIFCVAVGTVLAMTVICLAIVFTISKPPPILSRKENYHKKGSIGAGASMMGIAMPTLLASLTMIVFQISEAHQIIAGFRLPLEEGDYIVAAAFLL